MKITKKLPLKNITNFHPELKDRTEDIIERKSLVSTFTDLNEGEAIGIISAPSVDQDGDIIDPMGVKTDIYNGTCQWNHDLNTLPLGTISEWAITPEGVKGKFRFSKTYDFAIDCFNLVKEQILRGISIGYIPLTALKKRTSAFNEYAKEKGWDITGCERIITSCLWIETSLVPVGCNNDALILASKSFKSDIAFKSFKIDQEIKGCGNKKDEQTKVIDNVTEVDNTEVIQEIPEELPQEDIKEKIIEPVNSLEEVPCIVEEAVIAPILPIEQTVEVKPDVSEVIQEVIKVDEPKPLVLKIIRLGPKPVTEDIKRKALLFIKGKSF